MDLSKVTQQEGGRAELCLKVLWDAPPPIPVATPIPTRKCFVLKPQRFLLR